MRAGRVIINIIEYYRTVVEYSLLRVIINNIESPGENMQCIDRHQAHSVEGYIVRMSADKVSSVQPTTHHHKHLTRDHKHIPVIFSGKNSRNLHVIIRTINKRLTGYFTVVNSVVFCNTAHIRGISN